MRQVKLPSNEFEVLVRDEERLVLYDKVVDKLYTFENGGWKFPKGSRQEVITELVGFNLFGEDV